MQETEYPGLFRVFADQVTFYVMFKTGINYNSTNVFKVSKILL